MRSARLLLPALAVVVALSGACGGGADTDVDAASGAAPSATSSVTDGGSGPVEVAVETTTSTTAVPDPHTTVVARTDQELEVFAAPGDATPSQVLPATTDFGSTRALVVEDVEGDWLEVLLPTRPNGSTGWVHHEGLELRRIDEAVVVDLQARTLTVTDGGEVVLETPIAVGTAASPTPTGRFSIVDKLDTGTADGPYGPFALGLSGHSDVITEFAGGDGQIGIHGTDDPSSIGQAASHGCVRVPNEVIAQLNDLLPLGTPVTIL